MKGSLPAIGWRLVLFEWTPNLVEVVRVLYWIASFGHLLAWVGA